MLGVFRRLCKTHRVCCQQLIVGMQIMMAVKENSKHLERAPNNHRVQQVKVPSSIVLNIYIPSSSTGQQSSHYSLKIFY